MNLLPLALSLLVGAWPADLPTVEAAAQATRSVETQQDVQDEKAEVIAKILEHYASLGGFMVSFTRQIDTEGAPVSIPLDNTVYGALLEQPNIIKAWRHSNEGGRMQMPPIAMDTVGDELWQSAGEPLNFLQRNQAPASFADLLEAEAQRPRLERQLNGMIPNLHALLSLMTEDGFAIGSALLGDLEYAGLEGEDTELFHVFRGEAKLGGPDSDPESVAIWFDAIGPPWLQMITTSGEIKVNMGSKESTYTSTMITEFNNWSGLARLEQPEEPIEVENLGQAVREHMRAQHMPGNN